MEAASAAASPLPLVVVPECTSRATSLAAAPLLLPAGLAAGLGGALGLAAGEAAGLGCTTIAEQQGRGALQPAVAAAAASGLGGGGGGSRAATATYRLGQRPVGHGTARGLARSRLDSLRSEEAEEAKRFGLRAI